jgi:hypothetical protein
MAQPAPGPFGAGTQIAAVTAISPTDAWAAGTDLTNGTLIEHWDGTSWHIVPSPSLSGDPSFSVTGIAARSATDVYAVGSVLPCANCGGFRALILRWNGTAWTDDTGGAIFGPAESASTFPGAAREWAVGITRRQPGTDPQPQLTSRRSRARS